jgi:hypothetical protein
MHNNPSNCPKIVQEIVYTLGITSILHDSEEYVEVDNCFDSGCYSSDIHYSASDRQITKLIELSNECHQYFKVCNSITISKDYLHISRGICFLYFK